MLIDKTKLPLVDMDNMNEVHLEDVDIINELSDLIDSYEKKPSDDLFHKINSQYEKWYEHTVNHFENENQMMLDKNFPPYPMHKMEHDSALNIMHSVYIKWKEKKEIYILKKYIQQDLVKWLVNHIQTMDTITAKFLKTGFMTCHAS